MLSGISPPSTFIPLSLPRRCSICFGRISVLVGLVRGVKLVEADSEGATGDFSVVDAVGCADGDGSANAGGSVDRVNGGPAAGFGGDGMGSSTRRHVVETSAAAAMNMSTPDAAMVRAIRIHRRVVVESCGNDWTGRFVLPPLPVAANQVFIAKSIDGWAGMREADSTSGPGKDEGNIPQPVGGAEDDGGARSTKLSEFKGVRDGTGHGQGGARGGASCGVDIAE